MKIFNLLLITLLCFSIYGCKGLKGERSFPKTAEDERREKRGKVTGEKGISLLNFGGGNKAAASTLGVNNFLWSATLDTLSFMPLASADPDGGVVITDWYQDPSVKGERFKINALILGKKLQSNGIKVSLFKEVKKDGVWTPVEVERSVVESLEDKILKRARELKVKS